MFMARPDPLSAQGFPCCSFLLAAGAPKGFPLVAAIGQCLIDLGAGIDGVRIDRETGALFRKSRIWLGEVETAYHDVREAGGVEPSEGRVQRHGKRPTGATNGCKRCRPSSCQERLFVAP